DIRSPPSFPTRRSSGLMCAMIPMLRVFSSGTRLGMSISSQVLVSGRKKGLPGPRHDCALARAKGLAIAWSYPRSYQLRTASAGRSEEHTSELQSPDHLV